MVSGLRRACLRAQSFAIVPIILLASPAAAQTLGKGQDNSVSVWRVLAVLLLCLLLAAAGAFALRARMGRGPLFAAPALRQRRMSLVESMRLPNQVTLCIVTCDGRELLVATSVHGTTLLERLPNTTDSEVAEPGGKA